MDVKEAVRLVRRGNLAKDEVSELLRWGGREVAENPIDAAAPFTALSVRKHNRDLVAVMLAARKANMEKDETITPLLDYLKGVLLPKPPAEMEMERRQELIDAAEARFNEIAAELEAESAATE